MELLVDKAKIASISKRIGLPWYATVAAMEKYQKLCKTTDLTWVDTEDIEIYALFQTCKSLEINVNENTGFFLSDFLNTLQTNDVISEARSSQLNFFITSSELAISQLTNFDFIVRDLSVSLSKLSASSIQELLTTLDMQKFSTTLELLFLNDTTVFSDNEILLGVLNHMLQYSYSQKTKKDIAFLLSKNSTNTFLFSQISGLINTVVPQSQSLPDFELSAAESRPEIARFFVSYPSTCTGSLTSMGKIENLLRADADREIIVCNYVLFEFLLTDKKVEVWCRKGGVELVDFSFCHKPYVSHSFYFVDDITNFMENARCVVQTDDFVRTCKNYIVVQNESVSLSEEQKSEFKKCVEEQYQIKKSFFMKDAILRDEVKVQFLKFSLGRDHFTKLIQSLF
ncbi:hypothetical protein EIN_132310 [Entamoeba invadens IP1]|uniref:Uncharacterized protein n=1 Tax=Entamoeba invadens IP1 TaxID=370355 RepID=A0A0A1UD41_ENTIV|nr:hypothetical protein EIN_132310 [Entamoeba invadens IP1]ELP94352.1 hypothetical protein EIN_132310 [Entamoeba invadens IP1]|eukprot:XP_004261123.1 hypothetical protein EIN_132310 [Entamoeba invadens IP1]